MKTIKFLNSALDTYYPVDQFDQWPKKLEYQLELGMSYGEVRVYRSFMKIITGADYLTKTQIQQARNIAHEYVDKDIQYYNELFYDQFISDMKEVIDFDQDNALNHSGDQLSDDGHAPMGYEPVLEAFSTGYQFGLVQMTKHVVNEYMDLNNIQFSNETIQHIEANAFDFADEEWQKIWHNGFNRLQALEEILGVDKD